MKVYKYFFLIIFAFNFSLLGESLVKSYFIWDGGSRLIEISTRNSSPLYIVLKIPGVESRVETQILVGNSFEELILVPEGSTMELIIINYLKQLKSEKYSSEISKDILSTLKLLNDRSEEWPVWHADSDMEGIRLFLEKFRETVPAE